jgi:hypothetical protein
MFPSLSVSFVTVFRSNRPSRHAVGHSDFLFPSYFRIGLSSEVLFCLIPNMFVSLCFLCSGFRVSYGIKTSVTRLCTVVIQVTSLSSCSVRPLSKAYTPTYHRNPLLTDTVTALPVLHLTISAYFGTLSERIPIPIHSEFRYYVGFRCIPSDIIGNTSERFGVVV